MPYTMVWKAHLKTISGNINAAFYSHRADPSGHGRFSLTTVEAFSTSNIPVPNNVAATVGTNQVSLGWNAITGATSYNIYWSNKAGVSTNDNSTKISNVTSPYTHTGLTA